MMTTILQLVLACGIIIARSSTCSGYIETYPPPSTTANGSTPLYFSLITSFGAAFNSSGTVPGVQVALDAINSDPSLLPGYSLHYTLTDSQVTCRELASHATLLVPEIL